MFKRIILVTLLFNSIISAKIINYDFEKNTDLSKWNTNGKWKLRQDNTKYHISMIKGNPYGFNLCYNKNIHFLNGKINVKFKAIKGNIDQGGGIMWRVQDSKNYYVARFNPLEDNFRFYIVYHGIRRELLSTNITLSSGWHTMSIEQTNDILKGYIDGKQYLKYKDSMLKKKGGVGIWTKADAQTSFDHLIIDMK